MGCRWLRSSTSHTQRIYACHRGLSTHVISQWSGTNPPAGRCTLKLHSDYSIGSYFPSTKHFIVSDCILEDSNNPIAPNSGYSCKIGTESGAAFENPQYVTDVIVERNFVGSTISPIGIDSCQRVTVRNNIARDVNSGLNIDFDGILVTDMWATNICDSIWVYNNSVSELNSDHSNVAAGVRVTGAGTNIEVRNNVGYFPNWNPALCVAVASVPSIIQSNNVKTLTPGFVNPTMDDFNLLLTSELIDAGYLIQWLRHDKDLKPRGSTIDIGAFEYQSLVSNLICIGYC